MINPPVNKEQVIVQALSPFSFTFGQLQNVLTLMRTFASRDITLEEFDGYISSQKKLREEGSKHLAKVMKEAEDDWTANAKKCPHCRTIMNLGAVNSSRCNQVGGKLQSQWLCPTCHYDEYSAKHPLDWLKEIRRR